MRSVKNYVESAGNIHDDEEITIGTLQRQCRQLEKQVDKCFNDLDNVEEMFEQAKVDIKRFQ